MTQAKCVHSTPPTNASANNPSGPVDSARRHLLTIAAGGAVAAAIPCGNGNRGAGSGLRLKSVNISRKAIRRSNGAA
jgi:hypothetical protein